MRTELELLQETWKKAVTEDAMVRRIHHELKSINEYQCGDGSGTITVTQLVRFDFAELDIETFGEGQVTNGTWTLVGIGDYESLTGSGDIITNFDDGHIHMVGDVEA